MDGDTDKYAWEAEYKKSWDVLKTDQDLVNTTKRVRSRTDTPIQRGIIRQLCLCIDLSSCMAQLDFAPNRVHVVMAQCTHFITEFFDQNPISHIMLVGITNGVAECWSEWCGNPTMLIQSLSTHKVPAGNASLVNCLEMCSKRLMHAPSHVSREVLVVYGSLNTTDPTNIYDTLSDLVQLNMRVSIIGLSAFMNICNETCKKTGGVYRVALDEMHLKDLFFEHVAPPPLRGARHCLIQMGFPTVQTFSKAVCHMQPIEKGYTCPRCASVVCAMPMDCPICTLVLVSSPSLARSYHHLFPVKTYVAVESTQKCFVCSDKASTRCVQCSNLFCGDCDVYVHDSLHVCPGCS